MEYLKNLSETVKRQKKKKRGYALECAKSDFVTHFANEKQFDQPVVLARSPVFATTHDQSQAAVSLTDQSQEKEKTCHRCQAQKPLEMKIATNLQQQTQRK